MKRLLNSRLLASGVGGVLIVAQAVALTSCTTTSAGNQSKGDSLAAAGFVERPANTKKRQTMQARLPANQFLKRVHGNSVSYVYSDPAGCKCIYIGSQKSYDRYRQTQKRVLNAEQLIASDYDDDLWDWESWGPSISGFYGPFGPGWD